MKRFSHVMFISILLYMAIPITIFLLTWTRLLVSIPAVIILAISFYRIVKGRLTYPKLTTFGKRERNLLIVAFVLIAIWVYFSGIGGFVFQNDDHRFRNGLFNMLVNNHWPVVQTYAEDGVSTTYLLVYYIALWLPSAVVGKVFGLTAGYFFQVLWVSFGIWFFYYLISCYLKRVSLLPLVIFVFFSGLDIVGTLASHLVSTAATPPVPISFFSIDHVEWWCSRVGQFSSFTTQLFWVFNQAMPSWLLTIMLLLQKDNKYVIFLMGVSLLSCPLPFIGTIPFLVYVILKNAIKAGNWKEAAKGLFTFENVLGGGVTGIVTAVYFKANVSGKSIVFLPSVTPDKGLYLLGYVLFMILEVGIYCILIFKYQKKNPLFYIAFLFLCTCPLFRVGGGLDYCMRASIPALVVLFLLVVETIYDAQKEGKRLVVVLLAAVLALGAVTPIHEFSRTIQNTFKSTSSEVQIPAVAQTDEQLMTGECCDNFRGDANKSFFYKYLAR